VLNDLSVVEVVMQTNARSEVFQCRCITLVIMSSIVVADQKTY
jgi:hypothetical protein